MAFSDFDLALHGAALGWPADLTSLANAAATVSTEGQTITIPFCQVQFEQLSGSSSPRCLDRFVPITAQTVAGSTPKLGYSLLNSVLTADQSETAFAEFREVSGNAAATDFSPFIDVMQAQGAQADSLAKLGFHNGSRVTAGFGNRVAMLLAGVLEASLHAVIFRLV